MNTGKGIGYIAAAIVMAMAIYHATFVGYAFASLFLFVIKTEIEGYLDD